MTNTQLHDLKKETQLLLDTECRDRDFKLKVSAEIQEDDWVYLVVEPTRTGVHSEDYVQIARTVESKLEEKFGGKVLLVPARPQD